MALAKTPTEGKNWLPLLLAATVVLGGLVLWDRQSDDGVRGVAHDTGDGTAHVLRREVDEKTGRENQGQKSAKHDVIVQPPTNGSQG